MSEFPALRDALVGAATRRRRRRRLATGAVPLVAACAAVVGTLVSLPASAPGPERAAPKPKDALEQAYAVFRRPQRPEDQLPDGPLRQNALDPARSRLLAQDGAMRFYAGPTLNGRSLCTVVTDGGAAYGGGCGPISAILRANGMAGAWQGTTYALLFPDGAHDVRLMRENRRTVDVKVRENAILARGLIPYTGVSWTSASGTRYVSRVAPPPRVVKPPATCPASLDPLPPDAENQARRVALLAVDRLYTGAAEATVTGVQHEPGTPCGRAITARTLEVSLHLVPTDPKQRKSASLSQGRLLVGMQDGALRVFYLLH